MDLIAYIQTLQCFQEQKINSLYWIFQWEPVTALDLIQISNHQIYLFKLVTILQKNICQSGNNLLILFSSPRRRLSDQMFLDNPFQSNRSRNWFSLDWFYTTLNLNIL